MVAKRKNTRLGSDASSAWVFLPRQGFTFSSAGVAQRSNHEA